jgi:hypothetical protein
MKGNAGPLPELAAGSLITYAGRVSNIGTGVTSLLAHEHDMPACLAITAI